MDFQNLNSMKRDSFKVIFRNKNVVHGETQNGTQDETQNGTQFVDENIDKMKLMVLKYCESPKTSEEIRKYIGLEAKRTFSRNIINPLINEGKLDYTNKNSVNAKNQKYITIKK